MKLLNHVDYIVVHCADTPAGRDDSAADIRRWHVKGNGWADIGYHFVVRLDGTVEPGRDLKYQGAHVAAYNSRSVGVCYIGGKGGDTRTPAQVAALNELLRSLLRRFPGAVIVGHHDLDPRKQCPCFDAKKEYSHLT